MRSLSESSAIFSPSVARIAASNAKDWGFVDNWLALKFSGRSVPSFERNNDTLKALLTLASINELSDEEFQRVSLAESVALHNTQALSLNHFRTSNIVIDASGQLRPAVLNVLEEGLAGDDRTLLHAMACVALELRIANPIPESLGETMVHTQCKIFHIEKAHGRVQVLRSHIEADTAEVDELVRCLRGWRCVPSSDQARHNLDTQRRTRYLSSKVSELGDNLVPRNAGSHISHPMINRLTGHETQYSSLLVQKRRLERDVSHLASLPETADLGKVQLERLRGELRSLTQIRDTFENLAERERPRKEP